MRRCQEFSECGASVTANLRQNSLDIRIKALVAKAMNPPSGLPHKLLAILAVLGTACVSPNLQAGSATWSLTPQSGDWYNAANWVPETVPNGPNDVATFDGFSSILDITFPTGSTTVLDSMIINATPYYGITVGDGSSLTFVGQGALLVGPYVSDHLHAAPGGTITFRGSSVSEAGVHASGLVSFQNDSASIGNANVFGVMIFSDSSSAVGVVNALPGSAVYFDDDSTADQALVGVYGDGFADISGHNPPGLGVNILYADGTIFLGANNLTVTRYSRLAPVFSGKLVDGGVSGGTGGSLTKAGPPDSQVFLGGSSTYTGGTTITGGILYIFAERGSTPTGTGDVYVNNGGFGGKGSVLGNVIVGTGTGTPSSLAPHGSLLIRRDLRFASDGILEIRIYSDTARNDKVSARRVAITGGAQVELGDLNETKMVTGTILTLIDNTADTPIAGTFANLPDGGTLTVGVNTYEADYEGGDGNDLTLMVID
jgi:autotransporter-associated beta strand protein